MTTCAADRRRHPRFRLLPMYTPISVRLLEDDRFTLGGHAYDICEGGLRFELDRAIAPGTPVALELFLPGLGQGRNGDEGPGRAVYAFANVVWLNDEDEVEPVRMAAAFTRFARAGDRERLLRQIESGRFAKAA